MSVGVSVVGNNYHLFSSHAKSHEALSEQTKGLYGGGGRYTGENIILRLVTLQRLDDVSFIYWTPTMVTTVLPGA